MIYDYYKVCTYVVHTYKCIYVVLTYILHDNYIVEVENIHTYTYAYDISGSPSKIPLT